MSSSSRYTEWGEQRRDLVAQFHDQYRRGEYQKAHSLATMVSDSLANDGAAAERERIAARVLLGRANLAIEQYIAAKELFDEVLAEGPASAGASAYGSALLGNAEVCIGCRLFDDAMTLLEEAVAVLEAASAADDAALALGSARMLRGGILLERGSHDEARRELLGAYTAFGSGPAPVTVRMTTLYYLGMVEYEMGEIAAARRWADEAVALEEQLERLPIDLQHRILVLRGTLLLDSGELEEARRTFRGALVAKRSIGGEDDGLVAQCLSNLGHVELVNGNTEEAERLYREAHEVLLRTVGEEHEDAADVLRYLGRLYFDVYRDFPLARECLLRSCRTYYIVRGENDPVYRECLWTLGLTHLQEGNDQEAVPILNVAYPLYRSCHDSLLRAERACTLAAANIRLNALADAEQLLMEVLPVLLTTVPENEEAADILSRVAVELNTVGRRSEARTSFERALEIREALLGSDDPAYRGYVAKFELRRAELEEEQSSRTEVVEMPNFQIPGVRMTTRKDPALDAELAAHVVCTAEFYMGQNRTDAALEILNQAISHTRLGTFPAVQECYERVVSL